MCSHMVTISKVIRSLQTARVEVECNDDRVGSGGSDVLKQLFLSLEHVGVQQD